MPKNTKKPVKLQANFDSFVMEEGKLISEQQWFIDAWKELYPDVDWSSFCKMMAKTGIKEMRWQRETMAQAMIATRSKVIEIAINTKSGCSEEPVSSTVGQEKPVIVLEQKKMDKTAKADNIKAE